MAVSGLVADVGAGIRRMCRPGHWNTLAGLVHTCTCD